MKFHLWTLIVLLSLMSCSKKDNPIKAELELEISSQLGEGALWNYKLGEFYWVDIESQLFHVYNPKTKKNKTFRMPSRIGTVVPYTADEVVVALEDGIYKYNMKSDSLSIVSTVEKDKPYNRFNDGKCDPLGNLWVGSMHYDQSAPMANLYKINPNGKTEVMVDSVTISNGIVWTKDSRTMYYIDTTIGKIRGYDFDSNTGEISNERVVVEVDEKDGYPDGMAIDEEDMLWVGMWNGSAVARFNPKTGELLSKIEVPAQNVTACAFGGKNLDILYITTASIGMTKEQKLEYPNAGSVFKAIPGVKGVRASYFGQNK